MSIEYCQLFRMSSFWRDVLEEFERNLVKNSDNEFVRFRIGFVNVRISQHENQLLRCSMKNYNESKAEKDFVCYENSEHWKITTYIIKNWLKTWIHLWSLKKKRRKLVLRKLEEYFTSDGIRTVLIHGSLSSVAPLALKTNKLKIGEMRKMNFD